MSEKRWVLFEDLPKDVQQAVRLKAEGRKPIGVAWQNDSRVGRFGDIYHNWRTGQMEVCLVDRHPDGSQYPYRMVFDWHEWNGKFSDADLSWVRCWKKEARVPVPFTADFCSMCGDRLIQPSRNEAEVKRNG